MSDHLAKLLALGMTLKDRPGNQKTRCPECSHSRKKKSDPCLSVNVDKGVWNCHNCGWTGSVAKLKSKYPRPPYAPAKRLPTKPQAWFEQRGISVKSALAYNITAGREWMPQSNAQVPVLRFPFYRDGVVCNIKYRSADKQFRQVKDAEKILFGLHLAAGKEIWIWTEGELDVLALHTAGLAQFGLVSVPDGAPGPGAGNLDQKMSFLWNCRREIDAVSEHIIAVDSDENGRRLEAELARRIGPERCARVQWPEGCKDANDLLIQHGPEALKTRIEAARPFPVKGVVRCDDLVDDLMDYKRHGTMPGCAVGYACLDDLYRPRVGEMTIVTGMPGSGKSEFLDQLAIKMVQNHDWRFAVFSPENQPLVLHLRKLAEKVANQPWDEIPDAEIRERFFPWVTEYFTFLPADDEEITLDAILAKAKVCVLRYGVNALIIDPWNEIDHHRPTNLSETEYISQALSKIRRFARAHAAHVWVMAHPQKLERRGNDYPVARPYDISGSAHFFNKADNCLSIWRDYNSHLVEIHVQKVRFKDVGQPGLGVLAYERATGRYVDAKSQRRISS
ncbi:MAG: AAA family ATPase [Magnetococcales bacterium]|nr:AAA family ATPase [Magnetococcales bacterium]